MTAYDVRDLMKTPSGQPGPARRLSPAAERAAAEDVTPALSPVVLSGIVRAIEFLLVMATGYAVHFTYLGINDLGTGYVGGILIVGGLTTLVFQALGLYGIGTLRQVIPQLVRVVGGWTMVFCMALAMLFFAKIGDAFSRVWLLGWFVGGGMCLVAARAVVTIQVRRLAKAGRLDRRTAIVGGGEAGETFLKALDGEDHHGLHICGIFDDRDDERSPERVAGYPKLGTVDDLVEFARRTKVDLIVFTLPISAESRILQMLRKLWVLPTDIRLSAHTSRLRLRPRAYSYLGNVPVLDVFDRPIADWDVVAKWVFDKVVGTLLLILVSPILVATAIAVKLDSPGPVFFRQRRYGFNNELIEVFKFRSMYADKSDATASKLVTKGDPRVTRVGRFIRKTSIDELPQLFNVVFKGDLSLVGPRPHAVHAKAESRLYDEVVDGYFARHKVKPGITGWAQINGWRGETDTEEKIQKRVEHDLFYIENWSVLFDLYIVVATPFALLKTESAY